MYWNLADEPLGEDLIRSVRNAQAYGKAFPQGQRSHDRIFPASDWGVFRTEVAAALAALRHP